MYQKQSQRTKPSGNKEPMALFFFLAATSRTEIIRAVPRLRVFKLNTVVIIGLIGNNGKTVIVFQIQIGFIHLSHMFHSHGTLACCDGHSKFIFQISIDGMTGNLRGQTFYLFGIEIIVVKDQRNSIQITQPLYVVKRCPESKSCFFGDFFIGGKLGKLKNPCERNFVVPRAD